MSDLRHFSDIEPFLSVSKLDKRIDSTLFIVIEVLAVRYSFERLGPDLRRLGSPFIFYLLDCDSISAQAACFAKC